jgi:glycosyltransferase involved in cell wall biosynthesis
MLGRLIRSIFGTRARELDNSGPALYSGPRHDGFVGFIADVERAQFLAPGDSVIADQASLRLRVGIPAKHLQRYAPVCLIPLDLIEQDPSLETLGEPRAIAVGKFPVRRISAEPARFSALLDWIGRAKARHPIVADLSDDLSAAAKMYKIPWLAEFQQWLAQSCPLSVPSAALRDRVAAMANHGVTVIEDPFEREVAAPARFAPGDTLRLAWFGVFGPPLVEGQFADIARRLAPRPLEIAFVSAAGQAQLAGQMAAHLQTIHPGCGLRFVPWSREAVAREVTAADLVVLPQDATSEWGRVKSHNRLVEALRGGCFAVVSPIPSYQELAEWAWVGENLADGVEWALAHPGDVLQRIAGGQAMVEDRFSPQRIGERWAKLLRLTQTH